MYKPEPIEQTKRKCDHLESLIFNIKVFIDTGDLNGLKKFLNKNYQSFDEIIKQITKNEELLAKLTQQEQELISVKSQNKSDQQKPKNAYENFENLKQEKLKLEKQFQNADTENKILKDKINILQNKIKEKPFYREYDCMNKEIQGLKQQNQKLEDTIKSLKNK